MRLWNPAGAGSARKAGGVPILAGPEGISARDGEIAAKFAKISEGEFLAPARRVQFRARWLLA